MAPVWLYSFSVSAQSEPTGGPEAPSADLRAEFICKISTEMWIYRDVCVRWQTTAGSVWVHQHKDPSQLTAACQWSALLKSTAPVFTEPGHQVTIFSSVKAPLHRKRFCLTVWFVEFLLMFIVSCHLRPLMKRWRDGSTADSVNEIKAEEGTELTPGPADRSTGPKTEDTNPKNKSSSLCLLVLYLTSDFTTHLKVFVFSFFWVLCRRLTSLTYLMFCRWYRWCSGWRAHLSWTVKNRDSFTSICRTWSLFCFPLTRVEACDETLSDGDTEEHTPVHLLHLGQTDV